MVLWHSRWSYGIADVAPYGIERCIYHECIVATVYESWGLSLLRAQRGAELRHECQSLQHGMPAVEIRGCQSLLCSSHVRSEGASRYYVAPSAPPVTEIPSSRRVDPWVLAVESRGCQSLLRSSLDTHGYRDAVFQTGMEWLFFIFTYKIIYGAFIMK